MDEECEVKSGTEKVVTADFFNREDTSFPENGLKVLLAERVESGHTEKSIKLTVEDATEEAATSEPEDNSRDEPGAVDNINTSEHLDVKLSDQPVSHEESLVFEIDIGDDDGPPRLHLETPEREEISPIQEEKNTAEEKSTATPADKEDINHEEYLQLLQELREERVKASQHNSQLQMKLAECLCKQARDDSQLERELPVSEQLQGYERHINILTELKQQLTSDSETAQQQAQELSLKCQEKLEKVENEWQAFVSLKRDVAMSVLSRRLGKQASKAKVESVLAAEQLRQDELIKLRLKNIKLKTKIHRLEAELCNGQEDAQDFLQVQFEQLQADRLERKKQTEKQNEVSLKMQNKISSCLELLSNLKEKLFWSQVEVQAKQEKLAEVEATLARKRELLTRTKQARKSLQRDNLRLKEQHGLLGNRVLLRDFEDTVDASNDMEERLENLKDTQAEIVFKCSRWMKRLEIRKDQVTAKTTEYYTVSD